MSKHTNLLNKVAKLITIKSNATYKYEESFINETLTVIYSKPSTTQKEEINNA